MEWTLVCTTMLWTLIDSFSISRRKLREKYGTLFAFIVQMKNTGVVATESYVHIAEARSHARDSVNALE
jgi:hypothetical protein